MSAGDALEVALTPETCSGDEPDRPEGLESGGR